MSFTTTILYQIQSGDLYLAVDGYCGCNIREQPRIDSAIVGSVQDHESIQVLGEVDSFYKIKDGYVIKNLADDYGTISWSKEKKINEICYKYHVYGNFPYMHYNLTPKQLEESKAAFVKLTKLTKLTLIESPHGIDATLGKIIFTYYNCEEYGCDLCTSKYKYAPSTTFCNVDIRRNVLARTKILTELNYIAISLWSNHPNEMFLFGDLSLFITSLPNKKLDILEMCEICYLNESNCRSSCLHYYCLECFLTIYVQKQCCAFCTKILENNLIML